MEADKQESGQKPSLKERRRERERQDILAVATILFAELGFSGTTVQAIADRAEFSVGKIYSFYPSKEAIFDALIENFLDRMISQVDSVDRPDLPPLDRMRAWLTSMLISSEDDQNLLRVGILEGRKDRHHYPAEKRAAFNNKIAEILQAGIDAGDLPDLETEIFAMMIQGAIEELMLKLVMQSDRNTTHTMPNLIMDLMILPLAYQHHHKNAEEK